MKKVLSLALAFLLIATLFTGCQQQGTSAAPPAAAPAAPAAEPSAAASAEAPKADAQEVARVDGDPRLALEIPEKPYTIGFSTIYITPVWQQATAKLIESDVAKWKEQGLVGEYTLANANGETTQQISQIENMISQGYDAIILTAGSATALNPAIEKAEEMGIPVGNFDSLVTTDKISIQCYVDPYAMAEQWTQWLVDKIGGKGNIIVASGPAGISVAEQRLEGMQRVLDKYPDVKVVNTVRCAYNVGEATQAMLAAFQANPEVDGFLGLGGSFGIGALNAMQQLNVPINIPVTGDNYNGLVKLASEYRDNEGFDFLGLGNPNWASTLCFTQCFRKLQGYKIQQVVTFPSPPVSMENIDNFVPNDDPDDSYCLPALTDDMILEYLGPLEKAE